MGKTNQKICQSTYLPESLNSLQRQA